LRTDAVDGGLMSRVVHFLARSEHPLARAVRGARREFLGFTLPAPAALVRPVLWTYVGIRTTYHFVKRVLICEPLFKAYCTRYGGGVRTGVFVHWVQGKGVMNLGDNVLVDGKCSFTFTGQYVPDPTLEIGDHTYIGHDCSFSVGRRISIGRNCLIARGVWMYDVSGHPTDPAARLAGRPAPPGNVRPIELGDNVWIGSGCHILPGAVIGTGSVVSAGSVVRGRIPPYTLVAGNPAVAIRDLSGDEDASAPADSR
jgi:acetyltransferase-like isoleucine patch superfamily enzyme